ncbi:integrase catalytic domain-containing protein, partial [Trichonephila clavipes]
MGSLPRERVNPSFPFLHTGIDYCGLFFIRYKHQRKGTYQKIYVAIFVCLASKAVHLEIVSDLTTDAFLATLKRFVARRGKCATISSDNAKNFVGANRELKRFHEEKLSSYLSSEGISWNFMPPRASNFGGLWEAGVKSFKFYLKRAVGNLKMTLEEFLTIITQIERILNSRPITPLSDDIDDLEVLTPGHFLIGRPITSISEPNFPRAESDLRVSLLDNGLVGPYSATVLVTSFSPGSSTCASRVRSLNSDLHNNTE